LLDFSFLPHLSAEIQAIAKPEMIYAWTLKFTGRDHQGPANFIEH